MLARLKLPSLFVLLACLVLLGAAAPAHAQISQAAVSGHPPDTAFVAGASQGSMRLPGPGVTATTSITLLPATPSSPLSSSNSFAVSYTLNGQTSIAYVQGVNLALTTDAGSSVTISSVSTGSTAAEQWVLDSQGGNISISAGSPATLYYYDLLVQSASYGTSDGSDDPEPDTGLLHRSCNRLFPVFGDPPSAPAPVLGADRRGLRGDHRRPSSVRCPASRENSGPCRPLSGPSPRRTSYHRPFSTTISSMSCSDTWPKAAPQ